MKDIKVTIKGTITKSYIVAYSPYIKKFCYVLVESSSKSIRSYSRFGESKDRWVDCIKDLYLNEYVPPKYPYNTKFIAEVTIDGAVVDITESYSENDSKFTIDMNGKSVAVRTIDDVIEQLEFIDTALCDEAKPNETTTPVDSANKDDSASLRGTIDGNVFKVYKLDSIKYRGVISRPNNKDIVVNSSGDELDCINNLIDAYKGVMPNNSLAVYIINFTARYNDIPFSVSAAVSSLYRAVITVFHNTPDEYSMRTENIYSALRVLRLSKAGYTGEGVGECIAIGTVGTKEIIALFKVGSGYEWRVKRNDKYIIHNTKTEHGLNESVSVFIHNSIRRFGGDPHKCPVSFSILHGDGIIRIKRYYSGYERLFFITADNTDTHLSLSCTCNDIPQVIETVDEIRRSNPIKGLKSASTDTRDECIVATGIYGPRYSFDIKQLDPGGEYYWILSVHWMDSSVINKIKSPSAFTTIIDCINNMNSYVSKCYNLKKQVFDISFYSTGVSVKVEGIMPESKNYMSTIAPPFYNIEVRKGKAVSRYVDKVEDVTKVLSDIADGNIPTIDTYGWFELYASSTPKEEPAEPGAIVATGAFGRHRSDKCTIRRTNTIVGSVEYTWYIDNIFGIKTNRPTKQLTPSKTILDCIENMIYEYESYCSGYGDTTSNHPFIINIKCLSGNVKIKTIDAPFGYEVVLGYNSYKYDRAIYKNNFSEVKDYFAEALSEPVKDYPVIEGKFAEYKFTIKRVEEKAPLPIVLSIIDNITGNTIITNSISTEGALLAAIVRYYNTSAESSPMKFKSAIKGEPSRCVKAKVLPYGGSIGIYRVSIKNEVHDEDNIVSVLNTFLRLRDGEFII